MSAMGRGSAKTPERVVSLLKAVVDKMGQNATAKALGMPLYSVQKYISGKTEPNSSSLEKLSDYFKVPVPWLQGHWPEMTIDDAKKQRIIDKLEDCDWLAEKLFQEKLKRILFKTVSIIVTNEKNENEISEIILEINDAIPQMTEEWQRYFLERVAELEILE